MDKLVDDLNNALDIEFKGVRSIKGVEPKMTAIQALAFAIDGLKALDEVVQGLQIELVGPKDGDLRYEVDIVSKPDQPVFDTIRDQAKEVAALVGAINKRVTFIRSRL